MLRWLFYEVSRWCAINIIVCYCAMSQMSSKSYWIWFGWVKTTVKLWRYRCRTLSCSVIRKMCIRKNRVDKLESAISLSYHNHNQSLKVKLLRMKLVGFNILIYLFSVSFFFSFISHLFSSISAESCHKQFFMNTEKKRINWTQRVISAIPSSATEVIQIQQ